MKTRPAARQTLLPLVFPVLLLGACGLAGYAVLSRPIAALASGEGAPAKPEELFQMTKIWTVHLQLTAEQWAAMEPKGGFPGGPPGGPGGPPGGPGPRMGPGGPGGFGPAMFLAPAFLKGDQDHDGKLSRSEFRALGEGWFAAWDAEKKDRLTSEQLKAGLEKSLAPAGMNGPPPPMMGGNRRPGGEPNFDYVHADLEFEGRTLKDVALRYKGNSSFMMARNTPKRSFKIDLNKYVKGQKLAGVGKLNLNNYITDGAWMNEPLSYRLFRDAGVVAPRTSYARVYVTVPGKFNRQYFGLYGVVEDIDHRFIEQRYGTKDGLLLKPTTHELFEYLGDDWSRYERVYDPKTEVTPEQQRRVISFAKFVSNASDAEFAARAGEYLDLDEFARFMSVTVLLANADSLLAMGHNFYVFLNPKSNRFEFLPWDLDLSFGQFPAGGTDLSIRTPWQGKNRFLERVFQIDSFQKQYTARLTEFHKALFQPDRISRQVDEIAAAIRPAVREESDAKAAVFESLVAGTLPTRGGVTGPPRGMMGGPGGGRPIKTFVPSRFQSVADQLAGKSTGQAAGGAFGGRGGPGGPGRGPGPGLFGPATFLQAAFLKTMDTDQDGAISHQEFSTGFAKWFDQWVGKPGTELSAEKLREGINRDLAPPRGMPGGPGFGPPPGVVPIPQ